MLDKSIESLETDPIRVPHVPSRQIVDFYGDGRKFEMTIFSGDGKVYDVLAAINPHLPRRVGSVLLQPVYDQETHPNNENLG